jgi:hypothetical protein
MIRKMMDKMMRFFATFLKKVALPTRMMSFLRNVLLTLTMGEKETPSTATPIRAVYGNL